MEIQHAREHVLALRGDRGATTEETIEYSSCEPPLYQNLSFFAIWDAASAAAAACLRASTAAAAAASDAFRAASSPADAATTAWPPCTRGNTLRVSGTHWWEHTQRAARGTCTISSNRPFTSSLCGVMVAV